MAEHDWLAERFEAHRTHLARRGLQRPFSVGAARQRYRCPRNGFLDPLVLWRWTWTWTRGIGATMRLAGKAAVVTGGARGIGQARALGLAREGARVLVGAAVFLASARRPT